MGKKKELQNNSPAGEIRRNAIEGDAREEAWKFDTQKSGKKKNKDKPEKPYKYIDELVRLQFELIKLQDWVQKEGLKVAVIFEGRDAAGKGGVIKRITERC